MPWQVAAAKAAQHTMSMMGSPRLQTFKLMVWANLVNNCLVTLKSIRVADNVFGPDVASLQGKMVHQMPDRVDPVLVKIPLEIISHNLNVIVLLT